MTKNPLFYSPSARKLKRKRAMKNRKHAINNQRPYSLNPFIVFSLLLELFRSGDK